MNGTHAEPLLGRWKVWLSPSGTTILEAHYHFVGHRHFLQSMVSSRHVVLAIEKI